MGNKRIPNPDHGLRVRYQRGCRCSACVRANAQYQRLYRARGNRGEWRSAVDPTTGRVVYYREQTIPGVA